MRLNKELWLRFYIEDKVGMEYLSSIILHTVIHSYCKSLKMRENKELWLRSSIKPLEQCGILSMIHTPALFFIAM